MTGKVLETFISMYEGKLESFDWKQTRLTPFLPDFWRRIDDLTELRSMQRTFDPKGVIWNRFAPADLGWSIGKVVDVEDSR